MKTWVNIAWKGAEKCVGFGGSTNRENRSFKVRDHTKRGFCKPGRGKGQCCKLSSGRVGKQIGGCKSRRDANHPCQIDCQPSWKVGHNVSQLVSEGLRKLSKKEGRRVKWGNDE